MTTLRFEGRVAVGAPPAAVWAALTDVETLVRVTPGLIAARPNGSPTQYTADALLELGTQALALTAEIGWTRLLPLRELVVETRTALGSLPVTGQLVMQLQGEHATEILFTAVAELPGEMAPVARPIAARILQRFFVNLKAELETGAPLSDSTTFS